MSKTEESVALLLKGIPADLKKQMKASAAVSGISLRDWCVQAFQAYQQTQQTATVNFFMAENPAGKDGEEEKNETTP